MNGLQRTNEYDNIHVGIMLDKLASVQSEYNISCDQHQDSPVLPGKGTFEGIPENLLMNVASAVVSNILYHICSG